MAKLPDVTMTIREVMASLGIAKNTALKLVHTKKIPAVRLGRKWFVNREQFENYVNGQHKKKIRR